MHKQSLLSHNNPFASLYASLYTLYTWIFLQKTKKINPFCCPLVGVSLFMQRCHLYRAAHKSGAHSLSTLVLCAASQLSTWKVFSLRFLFFFKHMFRCHECTRRHFSMLLTNCIYSSCHILHTHTHTYTLRLRVCNVTLVVHITL